MPLNWILESVIRVSDRVRPYSTELGRKPQYLWYISLCLFVRRNTAKLLDRTGTCVVRGQRQALIAMELLQQTAQEFGPAIEALGGVEGVGDTQAASRGVHQLGQAFGAVGVSYHFCTFALTQGVPAVCLYDGDYYGQKGHGLCGFWADNRLALSLQDLTTLSAVKHIMQVFNDDRLRENLLRIAVEAVERWHSIFDQQVIKAFMSHENDSKQSALL